MRGRVTRVWFWKPFIRHNYVGSQSLHLLRSILPSPGGHRYSIQHWNLTQHGELLHLWLVSDFNIKHYNFKNFFSFLALWAHAWLKILGIVFNLGPKLSNGGDILSLLQKRLTEVLTDRDWTWAWQQLNIMLQHNQQLLWCVVGKWIRMFNSLDIESSRGNLKLKHVIECYKKEVVWKCSKLMVWKCSNYVTKSGCLRVIQFVKLNKN